MNDPEIFDLCKEVYKRTGWHGTDHALANMMPLYTSDYLLEKLPDQTILRKNVDPSKRLKPNGKGHYTATARQSDVRGVSADTPLKALLKLVIALHEAGDE